MAKKKVFSIGSALSQGLEETIESAQNNSGELRIDIIPLKKIDLDPDNPRDLALSIKDAFEGIQTDDSVKERKLKDLESLQSIANSIKTQGIINPVTVYKFGERYRLIAGERRTLASIIAGKTDIQAKILDDKPDELKVSILQWIENIERTDLTLCERLNNLEKIVAAYSKDKYKNPNDITITELSTLIGCVKSHAMNYKALLNADQALKKLISENKINNLKKAAFLSEIKDTKLRDEATQACIAGATLEQLKSLERKNSVKIVSLKSTERRGRQTTLVNFGGTKNINVAKVIVDSVLKNSSLSNLSEQFKSVDWNSHRSISETFKQLLKTLEKIHT